MIVGKKEKLLVIRALSAFASLMLVFFLSDVASAKPAVTVTLAQELVNVHADGTVALVPIDEGTAIARGAVIHYTIRAKNAGSDAARKLSLSGKIPAGTEFVVASVTGNSGYAEFSLDGTTFSKHPMVQKTNPDGTKVMVEADPSTYILLRWVDAVPLAAQATTTFSYNVRVK